MTAVNQFKQAFGTKRAKGRQWRGLVGRPDGVIEVSGKPDHIYVSIPKPDGTLEVGAFKASVARVLNLPVIVGENPVIGIEGNPRERLVTGIDSASLIYNGFIGDPSQFGSGPHAPTHALLGNDQVNLHSLQIYPLRVEPSGDKGIVVREGLYFARGDFYIKRVTTAVDLTTFYPTTGTKFVWVILEPNNVVTIKDDSVTLYDNLQSPPLNDFVIAIVAIRAARDIAWNDIIDVRQFATTGNALRFWDREVVPDLPLDGQVYQWSAITQRWIPATITTGDGGGGGIPEPGGNLVPAPRWHADGWLAVTNEVDGVWRVDVKTRVTEAWMYCEGTGTSGATIVDIDSSTDGVTWSSIFPFATDRPQLASGDVDHQALGIPSEDITIEAATLLRMNIEQVATGAFGLTVQLFGLANENLTTESDLPNIGAG